MRFNVHVKICTKIPGILYKFEKFMGDLPFSAYFDFETAIACLSKMSIYNAEMYPVS